MPELKRNFMQGRMNKDLDERIIPDGEYRDALNIEVSTAEESSVGTARNVPGNELVGGMKLQDLWWKANGDVTQDTSWHPSQADNGADFSDNCEIVGAITDPAEDKIYSFLANVLEPYHIPAGTGSNQTPTDFDKTVQSSTTDSYTVVLNNVTNVSVGQVATGTNVVLDTLVSSIDAATNTVTLSRKQTLTQNQDIKFSTATLYGPKVDCIMENRTDSYDPSSVQTGRLRSVITDVYEVYRVPNKELIYNPNDVSGTASGINGENVSQIQITESLSGSPNPQTTRSVGSQDGNMNFANGITVGARVEFILNGVNILGAGSNNPVTNQPLGIVRVKSIEHKGIPPSGAVVGTPHNPRIIIKFDKAISSVCSTNAIKQGGYWKFTNERLLDFKSGTKYDYTQTSVEGDEVIKDHITPEDTKITGIDVVDQTIYYTDGRTEPKRIDIEKGIKGSNYISNTNAVANGTQTPNLVPNLYFRSHIDYESPISKGYGLKVHDGTGENTLIRKNYELEDITVIRRSPKNPPILEMHRSRRVGITHEFGVKITNVQTVDISSGSEVLTPAGQGATGINYTTDLTARLTLEISKNKNRDYAIPSFYPGTTDSGNDKKHHSIRVGDVLSLTTMHGYSPTSPNGSQSDSGSRMIKVKVVEVTGGTFTPPTISTVINDYHDTDGPIIKNIQRDTSNGYLDFTNNNYPTNADYTAYTDITQIKVDIIEKNTAMSKENASTNLLTYFEASLESVDPAIYVDKFPRFAIRYRYEDGQISCMSPFSEPAFLPKTEYFWDAEEGQNAAMENDIRKIVLKDFITPSIPHDVVSIDVLVKFDGENNIYRVERIKKGSSKWNNDSGKFAKTISGANALVANNIPQSRIQAERILPNHSYSNARGRIEVINEKLGGVIPSNQILRPFDAVPIKAKAQCISASRLIYGNYTLDYDITDSDGNQITPRFAYSETQTEENRKFKSFKETSIGNTSNYRKYGSPSISIKSDRTYTLGIAFLDRFGRQTPVIVGPESDYKSPKYNAFKSSRLQVRYDLLKSGVPSWATDYRFYIKETSNEYYNISLYRAYPAEGDGTSESNKTVSYWLAFHSADRNKIQEDSILRLKSRGGGGAAWQYSEQDYRVLAISNEAPIDDEIDIPGGSGIPAKQRKGKFYVKVNADVNLIRGLKGPYGPTQTSSTITRYGGILSDYNSPAIFEILPDPDIGLNVFYEIPRTYPIHLNDKNIEDYVSFDDFVSAVRHGYDTNGVNGDKPTFRAEVNNATFTLSDGAGGNTNDGTGTAPNEFYELYDYKLRNVIDDLNTKILHVRGAVGSQGVGSILLNNSRSFGVPVLAAANGTGALAGTSQLNLPYTPAPGANNNAVTALPDTVSGEYTGLTPSLVNKPQSFGILYFYRLDRTKSSFFINNDKDGVPGNGTIGMYELNSIPSTYNNNSFHNTHHYLNSPVVMVDSLTLDKVHNLPFHNCWHFGNGVESDRIRDDFNAPRLDNGVKASSTAEQYGQKTYTQGLIFSGIYNAKTDVNNLNQFIKAEGITKDLNPEYGSIQKLFTRNTNVLAFCENKVLKILSNKDALFNADGNTNVTSNKAVLGTAVPFSGDHGISRNPESFAENEFRCYFTDRDRGAVCRLSMDGITPISDIGMSDYFADELKSAVALIGAFNDKKGEYDLTIHNKLVKSGDITSKSTTTVSFNEKTNSWVSFRSYIMDQGLSLNNEYYTFKKGRIWKHSDDAVKGRNNFYAVQYFSTITPVFNDAPGSVKSFQTINYEGTQAQVIANSRTGTTNASTVLSNTITLNSIPTGLTVGQVVTSNDFTHSGQEHPKADPVTITAINTITYVITLSSNVSIATAKTVVFSDAEYYNDDAYTGWYVESITTDQQEGKVLEFKEKEGKWFNYISGVGSTFSNGVGGGGGTGNIDSQEFSVQGIGHISSSSGAGNSGLYYSSEVTATAAVTCGVNAAVSADSESNIPHGTNFGTYVEFNHATGQQQIVITPPSGYSFLDPSSNTNQTPTVVVDYFELNGVTTQDVNSLANTFTTTITGPSYTASTNTYVDSITIVVNWHNGYIPNQNVSLSFAMASNTSGGNIQLYNTNIPINWDFIWEQGSSQEWSVGQPIPGSSDITASLLALAQGTNNSLFNQWSLNNSGSGNDLSSIINGINPYNQNQTLPMTFSSIASFEYTAENGAYFPTPDASTAGNIILESFIVPTIDGFVDDIIVESPANMLDSNGNNNDYYIHDQQATVGSTAYIGEIAWEFTEYDIDGNPIKLKVTIKWDPNHEALSTYLQTFNFSCSSPIQSDGSSDIDPYFLWEPVQDIFGGVSIPDDPSFGVDNRPAEEFEDDDTTAVQYDCVFRIRHQNADGSSSAGNFTTANSSATFSFIGTHGDNLSDVLPSCVLACAPGFSFKEANITEVDGNADVDPPATSTLLATGTQQLYTDGSGGVTLTNLVNSILIRDTQSGFGTDMLQFDVTFENHVITGPVNIQVIIKGDTVDLTAGVLQHSLKIHTIQQAVGTSIVIFGDGVSGQSAVTTAPHADYNVTVADSTTAVNPATGKYTAFSAVSGNTNNNVQKTAAVIKYKTVAGHRFATLPGGDIFGNVGFISTIGDQYPGGGSQDAEDNIEAWINAHINAGSGNIYQIGGGNTTLYDVNFSASVTGSNATVQEEITVTVKFTGTTTSQLNDTIQLFLHKGNPLHAVKHGAYTQI